MNQKQKSIRNIQYSMFSFLATSLLAFLSRSIFIKFLNQEFLGLNGFFSNVLGILALSELGVGTTLKFTLYGPIQKNDTSAIKSILHLFAKIYKVIGSIIILGGFLLTPFLTYMIYGIPEDMDHLSVYFILYVLNTGISYFFTYKQTLLICSQKEYILHKIFVIAKAILCFVQIAGMILTRNYMVYLIVEIIFTILVNVYISNRINKRYPFLKEKSSTTLTLDLKSEIKKNIRAMIRHKAATIVVHSTDNLLISKFVGLAGVGIYSNYAWIISVLTSFFNKIFSPLTPSAGVLSLSEDKKHLEEILYNILFVNFCIYFFCSVTFFCLVQPFIELWVGETYLLSVFTVVVITVNFYTLGMRRTHLLFWEVAGIFGYDKYKPIVESIVNLIASIVLGSWLGIAGVLLGTIISTVFVCFWWESWLLFKHLFGKSVRQYLLIQVRYALITLLTGGGAYYLCGISGQSNILIRLLICIVVTTGVVVILFHRTREFQYSLDIILHKQRT